jgi:putative spermidine/putrescine transport system permease protein
MAYQIQQKAFEPAAMAIISFALTWVAMGIIQMVGRGRGIQVGGGH